MTTLIGVLMALVASLWATRRWLDRLDYLHCLATLRGCAARLMRLMENNPRTMTTRLKESRLQTINDIAALVVPSSRPYDTVVRFTKEDNQPDRLAQAKEVAEWNEASASEFWSKAQSIRDLCLVFLILFRDRNILGASQSVTERMPDAALLGDLLGKAATSWRRCRSIRRILKNPKVVFDGLEYQPFEEGDPVYEGIEIIEGMRKYAR